MLKTGRGDKVFISDSVKLVFPCPVTASRWLSLASPNRDSEEDMFSSDLSEERLMGIFGALPTGLPLCILYSGDDEYVPKTVDKEGLLKKWIGIVKKGKGVIDEEFSGVIEGASHNLAGNKEEVVQDLVRRVLGFLNGLSTHSNL